MSEREVLETDVLVVGGGPAGLATAIHFRRLLAQRRVLQPELPDLTVTVIEKAPEFGAHTLSGAVVDAAPLCKLLPGPALAPLITPLRASRVSWLTARGAVALPGLGRIGRRPGEIVVSLGRIVRRLAEAAEAEGVQLAPGFAAVRPWLEGNRLHGVRTGDSGVDRHGRQKSAFRAGADIRARVTVLAEGARGSVTRQLLDALGAGGRPAVFGLGLKELWEVPAGRARAGDVLHTLGFPLNRHTYGGGFVYAHGAREVSIGLVVGLDYRDPTTDPYALFQRLKSHPRLRALLAGGRVTGYGARAIDESGWDSRPPAHGDGWLLAGESAGLLDTLRLRGVHLAVESGMLAGETALEALLADDVSAGMLSRYESRLRDSSIAADMRRARHARQAFRWGREWGLALSGVLWMTGGRGWPGRLAPSRGFREMRPLSGVPPASAVLVRDDANLDAAVAFDRATSLAHARISHVEDQPSHLLVADPQTCLTRCREEYGNACVHFCPAGVYEILDGPPASLVVHAANCLHCKTCEIMDPYQIITWVPPEGGGGPRYEGL